MNPDRDPGLSPPDFGLDGMLCWLLVICAAFDDVVELCTVAGLAGTPAAAGGATATGVLTCRAITTFCWPGPLLDAVKLFLCDKEGGAGPAVGLFGASDFAFDVALSRDTLASTGSEADTIDQLIV